MGSFNYVFNYTDHLGNVRISYAKDPLVGNRVKILEENHYYAFGLKHKNYNVEHLDFDQFPETGVELVPIPAVANASYNYKYNGKELQEELGLNFYDYGARNYDPALARWMNIDPLAETSRRWSPYTYCYNNTMRFTDPDGMQAFDSMNPNLDDSSRDTFGETDPTGMIAEDPGDYYNSKGEHLGKDKIDDNKVYVAESVTKDKDGYVTSATNSKDLTKDYGITHSQVLDRANWIYAEGGGDFPEYYAFAIDNFKDKAGSEKDMYKYGMQDTDPATGKVRRLDKDKYFSGGYENQQGKPFWDTRNNLSKLTDRMETTIAAVFKTQITPSLDPTGGCNQWRGGKGSGAIQLTDDGIYWHRFFKLGVKYSGQAPIIDTRKKQ